MLVPKHPRREAILSLLPWIGWAFPPTAACFGILWEALDLLASNADRSAVASLLQDQPLPLPRVCPSLTLRQSSQVIRSPPWLP